MLKKIRIIVASLFYALLTLLFLDFTGTIHQYLGWLAKIQFVPAILAHSLILIGALLLLTLFFGRIYCSVICPLGVWQDGVSNLSARRKGKKNRFRYSAAKSIWRYAFLAVFVVALVAGVNVVASLLDPYAAFGRVAQNLFAPIYRLGNNALAFFAEKLDSYAFYTTDLWLKSGASLAVAIISLAVVSFMAWRNGRSYCNIICPVGTFLGLFSKFSLFCISFDEDKCGQCKACERACKASCIDVKNMTIDHSRCVACFNCIDKCKFDGLKYSPAKASKAKKEVAVEENSSNGISRKSTLAIIGALGISSTLKAQQLKVDGGMADLEDKKVPNRKTSLAPPGAQSANNLKQHCTACQLCVSTCPNQVLRPSYKLNTFMQPEMSFERGYCRPECVACSEVCPTGSIQPIDTAEKTSIAIGHPIWLADNCVVNRDEVQCNNCEHHCPTGAISMVARNPESKLKTPVINKGLCIGCGACEHLCPARPFSAIYVEGYVKHHII
ncbi:MAG: 4Fe-4S dicluster domain-containing protein [Mangrovibacterium sp.]